MVTQLSYGVVVVTLGFLVLCIILLIVISPKAAHDYKKYAEQLKKTKKVEFGTSLTGMLERLSTCTNRNTIEDLITSIKEEAGKTSSGTGDSAQHAQTVLKWLSFFNKERHIADLKRNKVSLQIRYDSEKKDFKLLIISDND